MTTPGMLPATRVVVFLANASSLQSKQGRHAFRKIIPRVIDHCAHRVGIHLFSLIRFQQSTEVDGIF